jgi:hypothetical protein
VKGYEKDIREAVDPEEIYQAQEVGNSEKRSARSVMKGCQHGVLAYSAEVWDHNLLKSEYNLGIFEITYDKQTVTEVLFNIDTYEDFAGFEVEVRLRFRPGVYAEFSH